MKLLEQIKEVANYMYGDKGYMYLNMDKIQKYISEDLGCKGNEVLSDVMIEKIFFESIPMKEYAEENELVYSTLQKNKDRYISLKGDNIKGYTIDKFELPHNSNNRADNPNVISEIMGSITEDDNIIKSIVSDVMKYDTGIDTIVQISLKSGLGIQRYLYELLDEKWIELPVERKVYTYNILNIEEEMKQTLNHFSCMYFGIEENDSNKIQYSISYINEKHEQYKFIEELEYEYGVKGFLVKATLDNMKAQFIIVARPWEDNKEEN